MLSANSYCSFDAYQIMQMHQKSGQQDDSGWCILELEIYFMCPKSF